MIDIYRFVFYMNEIRFIVLLNAQLIHRVFTQCLARTLPSERFAFSSPAHILSSRHNVNPVWTNNLNYRLNIHLSEGGLSGGLRVRLAKDCSRKRGVVRSHRRCYSLPEVSALACLCAKGVTTPQRVEIEKSSASQSLGLLASLWVASPLTRRIIR